MNAPRESNWMDSLSPSGRPAPEPPAAFLAAVRGRRVRRRVLQASTAASALVVVVLGVVLMPRPTSIPSKPIAAQPVEPAPAPRVVAAAPVDESPVFSLTTFYTSGTPLDADQVPAARIADGRPERAIRGGDRWDPDQVASWLTN